MTKDKNDNDFEAETTHEQLVKEYLKYYQAHTDFNKRHSVRTHLAGRRHLRNIIKLARIRQKEIQTEFYEKRTTRTKTEGDK
jgi:hypothetical protein